MLNIKQKWLVLQDNIKGVAYIEFAIALPILLLLFAGGVELTRFLQANQKIDTAAVQLANFISRQKNPDNVDYNKVSENVFGDLISPFDINDASFIVSGISPDTSSAAGGLVVDWQEARGSAVLSSRVGSVGSIPIDIVNDLDVRNSESLIVVEVYYKYENIIPAIDAFTKDGALEFSDSEPLYQRSVMRYRRGSLDPQSGDIQITFEPDCCGEFCTGSSLPTCACDPDGGRTTDPNIAALYDSCELKPTCSNGGLAPTHPDCVEEEEEEEDKKDKKDKKDKCVGPPKKCKPSCKNGGLSPNHKKCNRTCENGGLKGLKHCPPSGN